MKVLRLSAWIVNYATGAHALACARSLTAAWLAGGRSRLDLSITVVDNASPEGEDFWLARLQAMGLKVVRSRENTGYAGGLETARALETGERAEVVALLNADLEFLPDSLEPLLDHLDPHPRAIPAARWRCRPTACPRRERSRAGRSRRSRRCGPVGARAGATRKRSASGPRSIPSRRPCSRARACSCGARRWSAWVR